MLQKIKYFSWFQFKDSNSQSVFKENLIRFCVLSVAIYSLRKHVPKTKFRDSLSIYTALGSKRLWFEQTKLYLWRTYVQWVLSQNRTFSWSSFFYKKRNYNSRFIYMKDHLLPWQWFSLFPPWISTHIQI